MEITNQDMLHHGFEYFRDFVNPFIYERASISREPIRFVKAKEGMLVDQYGHEVEDFHGAQAFGHRHEKITRDVQDYLATDMPSWYPSRVNPFNGQFAKILCERSGYSQVYFGCTGSEAVEAAMKLARILKNKPRILGIENAYHGCTFGSLGLMSKGGFRDPFGPHLPGVESIPFGDTKRLEEELRAGDVAALIMEPVQGEGGIRPQPDDFVELACKLTKELDILLVADEIQAGIGRSGYFLKSSTWPRRPDVALLAKALGGGLVPISATLTSMELFKEAYGKQYEMAEAHNTTFSNNGLGAIAGISAMEILTEDFISSIKEKGDYFQDELKKHLNGHELCKEVRGAGFMVGIELNKLDHDWLSFEQFGFLEFKDRPTTGLLLCSRLYKKGYYVFVCGHDWSVLRIQPRYDITKEKLAEFAKAIKDEMDFLLDLT